METQPELPVRPAWFERRDVAPGITWLLEPSVHGFLRSNIWHVRGRDRDLVVDTGMGIALAAPDLPRPVRRRRPSRSSRTVTTTTPAVLTSSRDGRPTVAEAVMLAEPEEATLVTAELPASFADALAADEPGGVAPSYLVDAVPFAGYDVATTR